MGSRAVLVVCLMTCFVLGGIASAADVQKGVTAKANASPALLAVTPPPPAPAELPLQDAVGLALAHNQSFRLAVLSLLDARSNLTVAQQRWGLSLFGAAQHGDAPDTGQAGANFTYDALTGATVTFQSVTGLFATTAGFEGYSALLQQPLLAGRGTASAAYEQVRSARSAYESGALNYYLARQDLVVAVINAYLDAVQEGQFVAIQQESVKLAEQSVQDAELRLKEGLITQIDLMRAQLRLAQAQSSEVQARQAQQDAVDRLLLLLGVRVGGAPQLVTEVAYEPAAQDVATAVEYALANRPELQVSRLAIQDRQAAVRITRSQRLPALNVFGQVEATEFHFSQQAWAVGLETTVPIGSRALREAHNQSQWALLVAEQDQETLRQQIIVEVRQQARAAEAARANVDIAAKAVEVAQESLRLAQRLVEEGLDTNRNVLDAQNDLTAARTTLVASMNGYYLAMVNLRRAMGMDVGGLIPAPAAAPSRGTGAAPPPPAANGTGAAQPAPAPGGAEATPPASGGAGAPKE